MIGEQPMGLGSSFGDGLLPECGDEVGDKRAPARLVGSTESLTCFWVVVFVEWDVVFPVRVVLKSKCIAPNRARVLVILGKNRNDPIGKKLGDLVEIDRVFFIDLDLYFVQSYLGHFLECGGQHEIDLDPNGPAPIGVATFGPLA